MLLSQFVSPSPSLWSGGMVFEEEKHMSCRLSKNCYCSVTKSCPTLCDPMNCSMTDFPVLHHLPEFAQAYVHWCHPTISSSIVPFSCPQSFPASGSFPMSQLFVSGGQSIRASATASVLPVNIQGWFPLGLTGLISCLSKGISRVFPRTTIQKHWFFGAQPSMKFQLTHPCMTTG